MRGAGPRQQKKRVPLRETRHRRRYGGKDKSVLWDSTCTFAPPRDVRLEGDEGVDGFRPPRARLASGAGCARGRTHCPVWPRGGFNMSSAAFGLAPWAEMGMQS